jgi:hypothetical protein
MSDIVMKIRGYDLMEIIEDLFRKNSERLTKEDLLLTFRPKLMKDCPILIQLIDLPQVT